MDEVLVVVDIEERLRRVHDPPDDDRGDLDGVPVWSFTFSLPVSKLRTRSDTLRRGFVNGFTQ